MVTDIRVGVVMIIDCRTFTLVSFSVRRPPDQRAVSAAKQKEKTLYGDTA